MNEQVNEKQIDNENEIGSDINAESSVPTIKRNKFIEYLINSRSYLIPLLVISITIGLKYLFFGNLIIESFNDIKLFQQLF
jgi:hypothetical protein